jgi:hypothetical protein
MEEFLQNKKLSENSKSLYKRLLLKLNNGKTIKNPLVFFQHKEPLLEKIKNYKPNSRKAFLISIVSFLKHLKEAKPSSKKTLNLYNDYYGEMMKLNADLRDNSAKTEKETDNWLTWDDVMNKWKSLFDSAGFVEGKKLTADQYDHLLQLMVLSLYCLQAPRRNIDYVEMFLSSNPADSSKNYLDLPNKVFRFFNYKTSKTYHEQVIPIHPDLMKVIDLYLVHYPLKKTLNKKHYEVPFLVNADGTKLLRNSNDMKLFLYRIFDGKKIGASMLRKIYLTSKYGEQMTDLKKDTEDMGTSTQNAELNYIKK